MKGGFLPLFSKIIIIIPAHLYLDIFIYILLLLFLNLLAVQEVRPHPESTANSSGSPPGFPS